MFFCTPGSRNSHYKAFCGCRSLLSVKIDAHLEIHFSDKQRFAIPSVKVFAHLEAGTVIIRRSEGVAPSQV